MSRTTLTGAVAIVLLARRARPAAPADKAAELSKNAQAALTALYAKVPAAKALGAKAQAVLVFPKVTKAGLGIGGQHGDGALLRGGKAVALLQHVWCVVRPPGGRPDLRLRDVLHERQGPGAAGRGEGFEVGVGPTVVVMDEGKAKSATTTTMNDDIYAFIFSQKGLMGGLGIQGNNIRKIDPS